MAIPNPQGNKPDFNFNRTFLEYVKDKPFYVMDKAKDRPVSKVGNVRSDDTSDLYFVGSLVGGNFVFNPNDRIIVYYYEKRDGSNDYGLQEAYYWVETVIGNFERGVWKLVEWYNAGITYEEVIKNLSSIKDFDPFGSINEEETKGYTKKDLEFFVNNKTEIYEINPATGEPFNIESGEKEEYDTDDISTIYNIRFNPLTKDYDICWYLKREGKYSCSDEPVSYVLDRFNSGRYIPKELYKGGGYFEGFENLNESEDDDFEWASEALRKPITLRDVWINDSLNEGDRVKIYGEVRDSENLLFNLDGQEFTVAKKEYIQEKDRLKRVLFSWEIEPMKRPSKWNTASSGNFFEVDTSTIPTDGNLIIVLVPKKDESNQVNESEEDNLGFDLGGESFGEQVPYSYLRVGDEIIVTGEALRGMTGDEMVRASVIKTSGNSFLLRFEEDMWSTHDAKFIANRWATHSSTMWEGIYRLCETYKCREINRTTRLNYYIVRKREELNESNELEYVIKKGTPMYCYKSIGPYEAGQTYIVDVVKYNRGNNGEDIFKFKEHEEYGGNWTIQKDENGLNYEDWFRLVDISFDTHGAFNELYESTDDSIKLEDGTSIVFPFDYTNEDVYKVLHWLIQNGWVKGYEDSDLKNILYDLDKPWNKGKRRPFFMLRKGGKYNESPTVYWAPTGDLSRNPKTFSKVIKAEDLLSSIDTDFFIAESIDDDFGWTKDVLDPLYNCNETVIVTDRGQQYSGYLNAMAELDIPYALEIVTKIRNKYNVDDVSDNEHRQWSNGMLEDHARGLKELESKNVLGDAENGDICCLYEKRWGFLSRLIRLKDGKNFIMNDRGFEPYNTGDKLNENEEKEWFNSVEDYTKYLKVGQRFRFKSRVEKHDDRVIIGQIIEVKPNYVKVTPVNQLTKKVNPFARGTRFTYKRILELLTNGDWIPVKS